MTDKQAVLRCQDGDREAFRYLVDQYQSVLYRTAMLMTGSRALAAEQVQETLRAAWWGIHGFQHGCPVKPWLMRILVREGASQRRKRLPPAGVPADDDQPEGLPAPVEPVEAPQEREVMRQALGSLDPDHRQVLVLRYFADMTVLQLARAIGAGEDIVGSRLQHALDQLRGQLEASATPGRLTTMAPGDPSDQALADALREHFTAEARSLRAPADLWDSLESRLEGPPRITWIRRKVLAAAARCRISALATGGAAAVAVWAATACGETQVVEKIVTQAVVVERVVEKVVEVEKIVTREVAAPAAQAAPAATAAVRPADTTFRDYGRQPFIATSEDAVSTFSLDTDRTSYQLALTWARQGYGVEPDSVRAEEWINAFDYQYAAPADRWGFAISSDVVRHPLDAGKHLARIGFQAAEVPDDRPLNVTLVLDASGSMREGNRVDIARAAAEAIRQSLRPQDRVAVVHFTDYIIDDLTVRHRGPDDAAVRSSIERLAPHGSTNVQAGLNQGVSLADQARLERPDAYNYVILMSDGVANVDATNPFAILESAYDRDARNPLRLITIGVGINNYNDVLLEQLAQHGNGWYRYLDDPGQARSTFSRENWLALSTPFADQTRAQVTWDPEVVKSWRIVGYENRVTSDQSFAEDRKEFAEIPSGASTTVFYELELQDGALGGAAQAVKLARVELRWVVPDTGQSRSQQTEVTGRLDTDLRAQADPLLELSAIVALASDRYGSLPDGDDGDAAGASSDLAALQERLRALDSHLGDLAAYQDFSFLLEHMAERVRAQAPPASPSGYNR